MFKWFIGGAKNKRSAADHIAKQSSQQVSEARRSGFEESTVTKTDVLGAHSLSRNSNPGSFIHRKAEQMLADYLDDPGICVVSLHGPSKQGKSTILRNVFGPDRPRLTMEASEGISKQEIYARLLNVAGANIQLSESVSSSGQVTVGVPGLGGSAGGEVTRTFQNFSGSLNDADWVGDLLLKSTQIRNIAIDSFHHIHEDVQTALAKDFTVLAGKGFTIVAAGTWKQGNYLVERNSDLSGQHKHVSVDPWELDELMAVVRKGGEALKVELGSDVIRSIAEKSCGSIAALQLICQQYHLDRLSEEDAQAQMPPLQVVNTAAQRVSRENAENMAQRLDAISRWGSTDQSGRHHVSFITDAILSASPTELRDGFTLSDLKKRTDNSAKGWRKLTRIKPEFLSDSEFGSKVKSQWTAHQVKTNNTPIFVWDRTIDRYIVNDAMLVFVHRTNGVLLRNRFRNRIRERLGI
jgi:Uri superfamily endonuclease